MLSLLAALPMCYVVIATDAPNPSAIAIHENAHCWGWTHPDAHSTPGFNTTFRAPMPSLFWRLKGEYPNKVTYFYRHKKVRKLCDGNPYGCMWIN